MDVAAFLQEVVRLGIDFYTGVPDSLLQPLCDTLYARFGVNKNHIVADVEPLHRAESACHSDYSVFV
jgi:phosphonopyruvate decarboxylase